MDITAAIESRRSIRNFKDAPIPEADIRAILHAGTLAPSGKNRQPWRFVVVQGAQREEMLRVMKEGIDAFEAAGVALGSSRNTLRIMAEAPVTIFVFADDKVAGDGLSQRELIGLSVDIQSIGAAIGNMLLAALERGLGTLWICDVFYAYEELCHWLGEDRLMVAAVAVGYPNETPGPRPRRSVDEVTRWLG